MLEFETPSTSWFRRRQYMWRVRVLYEDLDQNSFTDALTGADVLVSLGALSQAARRACDGRGTTWIDIEQKERADHGNIAGEEVIHFLKRYGLRLVRVPAAGA